MSSKLEDTSMSNFNNIQKNNSGALTSHYSKIDSISKMDTYLKKLYLPSIPKKTIPKMGGTTFNKKLIKSQSYSNFSSNEKTFYNQNKEKEKLMLAKISLIRIKTQINELMANYKKLLAEKEKNMCLIREAININDPEYYNQLTLKIEQTVEETMKNNKKNFTSNNNNNDSIKYIDDKNSKNEDIKGNNNINKNNFKNINDNNSKKNIIGNDSNEIEQLSKNGINNINDENKNENNEENKKEKEDNKNKEENKIEGENNSNEENKNIVNKNDNQNNNEINNENKPKHDYSIETKEDDINKMNSINNSHLINGSTSFNNMQINSSEEQINTKDIIEEKNEKFFPIESGLFEKSSIPSKLYNILKVKSELSSLKHKIINIQQQIKIKDDEIIDLKSKATMKNIIYQSNILGSKIYTLRRMNSKNKKFKELSLNLKNVQKENLKKELEYYSKINKSFEEENKGTGDNYIKIKTQYEKNTKNFSDLEEKSNNLKYKYNAIRLNDLKKQIELDKLKGKIEQIGNIKLSIEDDKKTIETKKKEIENNKIILEQRIKECDKIKENKEKKHLEMSKVNKETNYKISKKRNEINKIKKDIKEIEKKIYKEIDIYNELNTSNKNSEINIKIFKDRPIPELLNNIKELEKDRNIKIEEDKRNRFKKLAKSDNEIYTQISKIKKKIPQISDERNSTGSLPLLEEKLEYYLNSKGEKVDKPSKKK